MLKRMMAIVCSLLTIQIAGAQVPATNPISIVRVAAIGGINDLEFWPELSARFEKSAGVHVETVETGNKDGMPAIFRKGGIDLITMQSSDAIVGLVAAGYAIQPQPWMQTDLAIVGPTNDPAQIKGMTDASAAIIKIVQSKSPFVIHGSLGTDVIVRNVLQANMTELDDAHTTILLDDHQRRVLQVAADKKAYTLISRVAFLSGKIAMDGMSLFVSGDPILRRPYVVAIANPSKIDGVHLFEAQKLAMYLQSDDAQQWIGQFGKGKLDANPLYYPLATSAPTPPGLATISGEVAKPFVLTAESIKQFPHHPATIKDRAGKEILYEGVLVADLLKQAGAPIGNHQMRGPNLSLYLTVEAADGYRAVFSLAELDADFADHFVLLADRKDGRPLDDSEGPLRMITPQEIQQARSVRRVVRLTVTRAP